MNITTDSKRNRKTIINVFFPGSFFSTETQKCQKQQMKNEMTKKSTGNYHLPKAQFRNSFHLKLNTKYK